MLEGIMEERRNYMRFDVLLEALCHNSEFKEKVKVCNFSRYGIGVLSDLPIPKGKEIEIKLEIPGDDLPVVVSGELAWASIEKINGKQFHESGIRLKQMNNIDRGRILNYIYKKWMMPKSKKEL
ncbi:Type IV pilus assembly PilZ domain protein [Candidatus Omnitrophus magneticus]|uniref:Type IV pilus assembly PilZ domain protein n=1 Tax=Candidatus Omnitrophus magneticus TaxID=1609969 RepID=A0A0F0CL44_9BACT|nr:Type IV pilus assembly PilZ domain protein [Candidatus Omnitrophus magneticus]